MDQESFMVRTQFARNVQSSFLASAAFILAILFFPFSTGAAQFPANPAPASGSISGMFQPSLEAVRQTLQSLRIDKWKRGSIRDEASENIDSIQRDLRLNLSPLLKDADSAPGKVSVLLPVSRHVDALYDVLLRVTEASRVVAPDDQAAQLQKALLSLGNARLALDDRLQGSAAELEKQVGDLHKSIETEAARRAAMPEPTALPCVQPAPARKAARRRKPAAKPAPKPTTTTTHPAGKGTPSSGNH